jgi:hypothetical protein
VSRPDERVFGREPDARQVLESYNMEVSCGKGIKVPSFQGVVEPVRLEVEVVKAFEAGAPG